jgi:hypothetical protein
MNRNANILFSVTMVAVWSACSSGPSANEAKKAVPLDKIQGKAQVLVEAGAGATEAALNAGGSTVYLWEGTRRYRLFLRAPADITHGSEYVAEGIYAQRAIDEIGDPDQGKNGYPLTASCSKVVTKAWSNLAFDAIDANASLVCNTVKRYPGRALFLVTRIRPVTATESSAVSGETKKADEKNAPEVSVPADKQRALLTEGSTVLAAPLWEPGGGTASCEVVIDADGKIAELATGKQLCEAVSWDKFRYKPTLKGGRPVKVRTEVEVRYEAKK